MGKDSGNCSLSKRMVQSRAKVRRIQYWHSLKETSLALIFALPTNQKNLPGFRGFNPGLTRFDLLDFVPAEDFPGAVAVAILLTSLLKPENNFEFFCAL